jgi:hypothetical protein
MLRRFSITSISVEGLMFESSISQTQWKYHPNPTWESESEKKCYSGVVDDSWARIIIELGREGLVRRD